MRMLRRRRTKALRSHAATPATVLREQYRDAAETPNRSAATAISAKSTPFCALGSSCPQIVLLGVG
jgi:hypothetical protein